MSLLQGFYYDALILESRLIFPSFHCRNINPHPQGFANTAITSHFHAKALLDLCGQAFTLGPEAAATIHSVTQLYQRWFLSAGRLY